LAQTVIQITTTLKAEAIIIRVELLSVGRFLSHSITTPMVATAQIPYNAGTYALPSMLEILPDIMGPGHSDARIRHANKTGILYDISQLKYHFLLKITI